MNESVVELLGEEWISVDPIHTDRRGGRTTREYTYNRAYPSDVPEDLNVPNDVELSKPQDDVVLYSYPGKPDILITQDGPLAKKGEVRDETRKQAYFAMSILDSNGYVGGWKQR